jgi:hypothetical protein
MTDPIWHATQKGLIRQAIENELPFVWLKLTQDKYAKIDHEDAERVMNYGPWTAHNDNKDRWYAVSRHNGMKLLLHRFLMGVTNPKDIVDHINNNGLDNRRDNLRVVTKQQNNQNTRPNPKSRSPYKGVSFHSRDNRWLARIYFNNRRYELGRFPPTPEGELDAAKAYNQKAKEFYGDFAYLNPIPTEEHTT